MIPARRFALQTVAAMTAFALAGPAMATRIWSRTLGIVDSGSDTGFWGQRERQAALWVIETDNGQVLAFCIDPFRWMSSRNNYQTSSFDPPDAVKRLYEGFYPGIEAYSFDWITNGAFQIALWDLYNDDGNAMTGQLRITENADNGPLVIEIINMLTYANSDAPITHRYNYTQWTSADPVSQTILSVSPVPEPSVALMLAAGLGFIGAGALKKRSSHRYD